MKISNKLGAKRLETIFKFPPVVVEQTNFRISDIIRKNQAGQQVLGVKNLQFDFRSNDPNVDFEKVNPFSRMDFDLDDVIVLAQQQGRAVTDLQNRLGEIRQELDSSKSVEQEVAAAPQAAPAPTEPTPTA